MGAGGVVLDQHCGGVWRGCGWATLMLEMVRMDATSGEGEGQSGGVADSVDVRCEVEGDALM